MNIGDTVESGGPDQTAGPVQSDQSFWEGRTTEQLREMLDRGLAAGDAFVAAAAEIERRASETARRARQSPIDTHGGRQRRLPLVKLGALLAAVVIGAAVALYELFF